MKYEEIANRIKTGQKTYLSEVTCTQIFMLLHDRIIKSISYYKTIYEFNFIPVEEPIDNTIFIDDELYPDPRDCEKIFKQIIDLYKCQEQISVNFNEELFEIKVEVLESNE